MKTKHEFEEIKKKMKAAGAKLSELSEDELKEAAGGVGMVNPVAGMSFNEAVDIALKLGKGQDMGSWKTMGAAEFIEWWKESNPDIPCPDDVLEALGIITK